MSHHIVLDQRFPTWGTRTPGVRKKYQLKIPRWYANFNFSVWGYVSKKRLGIDVLDISEFARLHRKTSPSKVLQRKRKMKTL